MTENPVAVIDIGSNSARIVVYRLEEGLSTQILASSRGSLRLVRELDATHRLSDAAEERAFEALQDFRAIALGTGAARVFALATAAVRDAENGKAFMAEVKKRLDMDVRILSGEEEARYGFLGAVGGLPVEHGVLFDVGGGSMQVTRFRHRRITSAVSLPLGSLRLSDAFLKSDPPGGGRDPAPVRARREACSRRPGCHPWSRGSVSWARGARSATWPRWTGGPGSTRSRACTGTCCRANVSRTWWRSSPRGRRRSGPRSPA